MNDVIIFVIHGIIGALLHLLIHVERLSDIKDYTKDIIIGGIAGYIYYHLYSYYSLPNGFLAIIFGYFSKDIIYVLFEKKFKRIIEKLVW